MQHSDPSDGHNPPPAGPSAPNHHAMSSSAIPRSRSDDSWIEVSSRPSSSSLSSIADEIITTGLRIQLDPRARRRRRMRHTLADDLRLRGQSGSAGGSSQDDSEESDSDSDRAMSESNDALQPSPLREEWRPSGLTQSTVSSENADISGEGYEDDGDENATAIGVATSETSFVPQPNAFSRPAPTRHQTSSLPHYGPEQRPHRPSQRHSYPSQDQHSPFNMISPSHQADHDAALRASLSTLLSCAAAARSLPKSRANTQASQPIASNRIDPSSLRMVPEYMALGGGTAPSTSATATAATQDAISDKGKRKAVSSAAVGGPQPRSNSRDRRVAKKPRRTVATSPNMEDISPTLLTWVVGAGVLVLVSAISFSAGYVTGREAGHAEMAAGMSEAGAGMRGCGKDLAAKGSGLGLRRWTGAATGVHA